MKLLQYSIYLTILFLLLGCNLNPKEKFASDFNDNCLIASHETEETYNFPHKEYCSCITNIAKSRINLIIAKEIVYNDMLYRLNDFISMNDMLSCRRQVVGDDDPLIKQALLAQQRAKQRQIPKELHLPLTLAIKDICEYSYDNEELFKQFKLPENVCLCYRKSIEGYLIENDNSLSQFIIPCYQEYGFDSGLHNRIEETTTMIQNFQSMAKE